MSSKPDQTRRVVLKGGPYDGQRLTLTVNEGGTAVLRVGKWHGYYNQGGYWVNAEYARGCLHKVEGD